MRKKKETRKYKPKNEFRYNNSPVAKGHLNHVFGETKTKYKSLGLTHTPKEEYPSHKLKVNPDPTDKRAAYLQTRILTSRKDYFGNILPNLKIDKEDMPIVRYLIKKYKKATNRSKKDNKKR